MRDGQSSEVLNLCFHGIGRPGRPLEPDEELYWVEPEQFEEVLDVAGRFPTVRITFDDGNASDVATALPSLLRRQLTAAFFVIAGRVGEPGSVSAADVATLARSGMTVGSHGMRHRPWRSLSDQDLREELTDAAARIADLAGQPVREAACPFGAYDRRVLAGARAAGFSRVYTVDGGPARQDAWLQSRYTVRAGDTGASIEQRARAPRGSVLQGAVRDSKSLVKRWR